MSDPSATSLFRDIHAHSLSELLTSVLHQASLGSILVSAVDEHLNQTRPTVAGRCGDIIEVQGPAASGKSHMLYYFLMTCVIPPSFSSVKLSGWGKAAVHLDTDHKFDVRRFGQLLRSRVKRLLPPNSSSLETIATKALDLLHVFQPTSSHQLAATIQHLPMYLATNLPEADLGLVAVDSITAFYWPDRYILEQARSGNPSPGLSRQPNPLTQVLVALQSLAQSHGPMVLLSSWDLSSSSTTENRRRLDAPVPAIRPDTDKTEHRLLPVLYHISLLPPSFVSDGETTDDVNSGTTCLLGTVRTLGSFQASQFKLHITEDDIVVS